MLHVDIGIRTEYLKTAPLVPGRSSIICINCENTRYLEICKR